MVLIVVTSTDPDHFLHALQKAAPTRDLRTWPDAGDAADIRYVLAWHPPHGEIKKFTNLEVIFSVGAGVDHLLADPDLPDVPIVRFVDANLTQRMVEYVVLHTLLHHRRMPEYLAQQAASRWHEFVEPAAGDVRVGILGFGVLGQAAGAALTNLGYDVAGWSRTPKVVADMVSYAGADGLNDFLGRSDILVVLLPLTPDTRGIVNAALLKRLAHDGHLPGPTLINAGRGGLQVEADILAALDAGDIHSASLDVFESEPLPAESPLWRHPRIVVTPHNSAVSDNAAMAAYVLDQVAAYERGDGLTNIVTVARGY